MKQNCITHNNFTRFLENFKKAQVFFSVSAKLHIMHTTNYYYIPTTTTWSAEEICQNSSDKKNALEHTKHQ